MYIKQNCHSLSEINELHDINYIYMVWLLSDWQQDSDLVSLVANLTGAIPCKCNLNHVTHLSLINK